MAIRWVVTDSTSYPWGVELCVRFTRDDGLKRDKRTGRFRKLAPITDYANAETRPYIERRVQTDGSIPDLAAKIERAAVCFTRSTVDVAPWSAPFRRFGSRAHMLHALELVRMDPWLLLSRPRAITRTCDVGLRDAVGVGLHDGENGVYRHAPSDTTDMRQQLLIWHVTYGFLKRQRALWLMQWDASLVRYQQEKARRVA